MNKAIFTASALLVLAGIMAAEDMPATVPKGVDKSLRFAAVLEFATGPIMTRFIEGMQEEAALTGVELTVYDAGWDMVKMIDQTKAAIIQKVDAILIDHGKPEPLTPILKEAVAKGIKVVTFDCDVDIPGVTVIDQNDTLMAQLILDQMVRDINASGNIVKIWVPGFAPMEKRQKSYAKTMKANPSIKEIAAFGVASNTTMLETENQMNAVLKQYPKKNSIAAVWASWDEFAKGSTKAIMSSKRNEICVYGFDVTDEDLQMMQAKGSPWIATVAVDCAYNAKVQFRVALCMLAGEEMPATFGMPPILILRSQLPEEIITLKDLYKYVPGWGDQGDFVRPWMKSMKK